MTVETFMRTCNACGNFSPQRGGGIRIVQNFRQWVCHGCKTIIDEQKEPLT